jgi:hypothetical protein
MNKRKGLSIVRKFTPDHAEARDEGSRLLPLGDTGAKSTSAELAAIALRDDRPSNADRLKMQKGKT